MWELLSRLKRLTLNFLIQFVHSYQSTWPSIFKAAWPRFIFHVVWQNMELTHLRWESDHQWVCTSIPHLRKALRQNSWQGFRWRGTFQKSLRGILILMRQCCSRSNSLRVIPGWCLWARFHGQVRFGSFLVEWPTGPFGRVGSYSHWRRSLPTWIGLWECGGFSCHDILCWV